MLRAFRTFPHLSAPFPHLDIRTRSAPPHHLLRGCGGAVRKVSTAAAPTIRTARFRTLEERLT